MSGRRYASERGDPMGSSTTPSHRAHRPACPHHQRHARTHQVSDYSPHRGARHLAKRRPKPSAKRWARLWGIRRAPKGVAGSPPSVRSTGRGPGAAPVLSDLLGPQPCAQRWTLPSGLRPAPKGGLAAGQPECNGRATRRETPLLERPAHAVSAQRPRCGAGASALGAAPRRERCRQPSAGLAVAATSAR